MNVARVCEIFGVGLMSGTRKIKVRSWSEW